MPKPNDFDDGNIKSAGTGESPEQASGPTDPLGITFNAPMASCYNPKSPPRAAQWPEAKRHSPTPLTWQELRTPPSKITEPPIRRAIDRPQSLSPGAAVPLKPLRNDPPLGINECLDDVYKSM